MIYRKSKARFDSGDLSARDLDDLADRIEDEVMRCGDAGRDSKGCCASFRVDESKVKAPRCESRSFLLYKRTLREV